MGRAPTFQPGNGDRFVIVHDQTGNLKVKEA
jgi:hypothetical protein